MLELMLGYWQNKKDVLYLDFKRFENLLNEWIRNPKNPNLSNEFFVLFSDLRQSLNMVEDILKNIEMEN